MISWFTWQSIFDQNYFWKKSRRNRKKLKIMNEAEEIEIEEIRKTTVK